MIDLDSGSTWTNTDSGNWLKSSKSSEVKIYSESGSKSRSWDSSPHSFSHNGMWLFMIGDLSSRMTGMKIKTNSKMFLKLGNKTWVILIRNFELDNKIEDRDHILVWVQFHENENLLICQCDSQKYDIS